jgi:hypothetical protein
MPQRWWSPIDANVNFDKLLSLEKSVSDPNQRLAPSAINPHASSSHSEKTPRPGALQSEAEWLPWNVGPLAALDEMMLQTLDQIFVH